MSSTLPADFDPDQALARVSTFCEARPLSLIRIDEDDTRSMLVRQDLCAWGDGMQERHLGSLGDEQLFFADRHLVNAEPDYAEAEDELRYWRHIYGLEAWAQGGPHPLEAQGLLASGYLRASAAPELTHQRIVLGAREMIVTQERLEMIQSTPELIAQALVDPDLHERRWSSDLEYLWREAEFAQAISFAGDALPAIAPSTPLTARKRPDGSWIFEHPLAPAWLCMMPALRAAREAFFHNGTEPMVLGHCDDAYSAGSGIHDADGDDGWSLGR